MKSGGTRGLEEATVGVGNRGLVSAPGKAGDYSLSEEQIPNCSFTDSIAMAGCSSQLIQAPLDCEQSSRGHNSRCFSKNIRKDRF